MYNKGANLLHTIRQVIDNDSLFRKILRGLNKDFYHQTVDSKDVENYMSNHSGKDLSKIFDQYLRTTKIPVLECKETNDNLSYRWSNVVPGFNMPVRLKNGDTWLYPTTAWKKTALTKNVKEKTLGIDERFYVELKMSGSFKSIPPPPADGQ